MNVVNSEENALQTQCRAAASIVVDAMMMAGILEETDSQQAIDIIAEEILVRKVTGRL